MSRFARARSGVYGTGRERDESARARRRGPTRFSKSTRGSSSLLRDSRLNLANIERRDEHLVGAHTSRGAGQARDAAPRATRGSRRAVDIARDAVMVMRVASRIFLCTNGPESHRARTLQLLASQPELRHLRARRRRARRRQTQKVSARGRTLPHAQGGLAGRHVHIAREHAVESIPDVARRARRTRLEQP